jgi:hypothetical protein
MMLKRLKRIVIGGAVLAGLALGSSSSAGAATGRSGGSSSTMTTLQGRSGSEGPSASFTTTHSPGTAAHENTEQTVTGDAAAKATAAPPASGRVGSAGAMNHVRDRWIRDLYLTDHEQDVRHHERLAVSPG